MNLFTLAWIILHISFLLFILPGILIGIIGNTASSKKLEIIGTKVFRIGMKLTYINVVLIVIALCRVLIGG